MAGFYEDRVRLFRLFTVLHFVGKSFLNLFGCTSVVKKYVSVFPELGDVEVPLAEYFLSVLQIDFRYDGSTSTASSHSIRQHLQPPFVVTRRIFSNCLGNRPPV